jgi:hypothetical protein
MSPGIGNRAPKRRHHTAYDRRCGMTDEPPLPALEAAHFRTLDVRACVMVDA